MYDFLPLCMMISYFLACIAVGYASDVLQNKGGGKWFFAALFITPILAAILLLCQLVVYRDEILEERQERLRNEWRRENERSVKTK